MEGKWIVAWNGVRVNVDALTTYGKYKSGDKWHVTGHIHKGSNIQTVLLMVSVVEVDADAMIEALDVLTGASIV